MKSWRPKNPETEILFDPKQYELYKRNDDSCIYLVWPLSKGKSRHGEFPLMVAREHFRGLGYVVWASEPELPNNEGYLLVSYSGKRRNRHPAFEKMKRFFDQGIIDKLNAEADRKKLILTGSTAGGDPDLFVFNKKERFFVEVKWKDGITPKQNITFPLIERHCVVEVKVARIHGLN